MLEKFILGDNVDFIFDDELIEEVVIKYSDMVYRIALNILCNIDDANDVMQDVSYDL